MASSHDFGHKDTQSLRNEESFFIFFEHTLSLTYFIHFRVTNCTEYFFGLDYPSSFTSGGANEYVLSFNDNFMSILGNEEILWNFYYNGNLAMESCSKVQFSTQLLLQFLYIKISLNFHLTQVIHNLPIHLLRHLQVRKTLHDSKIFFRRYKGFQRPESSQLRTRQRKNTS